MPVRALNLYYPRDESVLAEVLATRLRATDVRQGIGIPRGRVFTRASGGPDLPDVMWDCPFPDAGAHEDDMRARAASADFEACRVVMRNRTRRFERVIYDEARFGAEREVVVGERLVQVWLTGDGTPDVDALNALPAATSLHRTDENARLPSWIVEAPIDGRSQQALDAWIARLAGLQAMRVTWERVG